MTSLTCRPLRSDAEIDGAFSLMSTLRDRIRPETFLDEIRRQQRQGYELIGGYVEDELVALAGIRRTHTLARGEHMFVDDLVTSGEAQGRGYGTAMLRFLAVAAAADGVARIYLDARDTARGFYAKLGVSFLTSTPCFIDVRQLAPEIEVPVRDREQGDR